MARSFCTSRYALAGRRLCDASNPTVRVFGPGSDRAGRAGSSGGKAGCSSSKTGREISGLG